MVVLLQRASPHFWNSNPLAAGPWWVDLCTGAASQRGSTGVTSSETAMGEFGVKQNCVWSVLSHSAAWTKPHQQPCVLCHLASLAVW